MQIPVIDTHVHLDQLINPDDAILEARIAGLSGLIAVGLDIASNEKILSFSRQYGGVVFPAIGYHPWNITISGIRDNLDFIEKHLDEAVAIGEVGLDFKISLAREIQQGVFEEILDLAWKKNKPVIVHSRLSHEESFESVRKHNLKKAVFHWYSGPIDILKELLLMGYYISATPALNLQSQASGGRNRGPVETNTNRDRCPDRLSRRGFHTGPGVTNTFGTWPK